MKRAEGIYADNNKLSLPGKRRRRAGDILQNINLTVEKNRFVVITGPNGGGKTTLAKAIMGLIRPTGGGSSGTEPTSPT
jgi:ABC-type Mn2+/Zn2+ transport system ATPase subunit